MSCMMSFTTCHEVTRGFGTEDEVGHERAREGIRDTPALQCPSERPKAQGHPVLVAAKILNSDYHF